MIVALASVAGVALLWASYLTVLVWRGPRYIHNVSRVIPGGFEVVAWHWLRGWRLRYRFTQTTGISNGIFLGTPSSRS